MGRSSREKRDRQKERIWSTTNPWTGKREQFMVRVSAAALLEWEVDRVRLNGEGYPDRPPEIDTATSRSWASSPSAAGGPKIVSFALAADPTARGLGAWAARDGVSELKANLGQRPDGKLILDLRAGPINKSGRYLLRGVRSVDDAGKIVRDTARLFGLPEPAFVGVAQLVSDMKAGPGGPGGGPH